MINNGTSTKTRKPFTAGSVNFIVSNAGKLSAKSIANVIHRTEKSVRRKAEKLGLSLKVRG